MTYYAYIKESAVIGIGQAECLNAQNIVISEEIYNNVNKFGVNYYLYENEKFILNPDYEAEQAEKEREELDKLSLTKREVFLALYKDKQLTPEQLKTQITDPEALIEFEYANDYYRGNPLINLIGEKLGYTTEELDYLFKNGELPKKEESEKPETEETTGAVEAPDAAVGDEIITPDSSSKQAAAKNTSKKK